MPDKKEADSVKSLKTAELAIRKMQTFARSTRPRPNIVEFRAESYLWKKFISLDGEHHLYTTVVLICMSLALLIWFFERRLLEGRYGDTYLNTEHLGVAETRLLRSLLLILGAILNGIIAFFLLALNLKDLKTMPETASVRWLFLSAFGFIAANVAALGVVKSAQQAYKWRTDRGSYEKPFPHYMILAVFIFFMIFLDILYIGNIYLPFFESKAKGWEFIRRNMPEIIEVGKRQDSERSLKQKLGFCVRKGLYSLVRSVNFCIYIVFYTCERCAQWWIDTYNDEDSFTILKELSRGISFLALLPFRLLRWSFIVQLPYWITKTSYRVFSDVLSHVFQPLIIFAHISRLEGKKHDAAAKYRLFRGFLRFLDKFGSCFSNFKPEVQRAANELWEDIKEDAEYKHSSWLKAAVITASIFLLYFGLQLVDRFRRYMDDVYTPTRDCIINNPGVSNFFLRFIGFNPPNSTGSGDVDAYTDVCAASFMTGEQTSQVQDLFTNLTRGEDVAVSDIQSPYLVFSRRLEQRIQEDLEEDKLYKCEEGVRQENVCVLLSAVNLAEDILLANQTDRPSDEFFGSFTGEVVYVFDVYMRNLDWAVWIGFTVGMIFGLWTLLSVMAQYKRLSLAIRAGVFQDFHHEKEDQFTSNSTKMCVLKRVDSVIDSHSFAHLISHYPMSVSIFFSGMLISTSVLQLVVFGTLVSSIASLIASLSDSKVLNIVSPLLWMLLAFFITWLVNGPIATMVLGEGFLVSHFRVVHEILFFLFLLVFTSIHLVLGIFLAFFRMLWVLLTALMTINRLDKNLFTVHRERDLGHKSFMALLFMQHVFHVNQTASPQQRSMWENLLDELDKDSVRISLLQTQIPVRHRSQPVANFMEEEGLISEIDAELGRTTFQR